MAPKKKPVSKTQKIKIIVSPAGKFKLSYDVGKTYEVEKNIATILIDAKYAEAVK